MECEYPQLTHFNRSFHSKPSILGYAQVIYIYIYIYYVLFM